MQEWVCKMAKTQAIGHIDCHFCGFDAEVKISAKSQLAYTFCPDCNAQSFCRNQHQYDKLIAKMRPVTVINQEPQPVTVTENLTVEKPKGFSLGSL